MPPRNQTAARPPQQPTTALQPAAVARAEAALEQRQQYAAHPIVAYIEQAMPRIEKLLPAAVNRERFGALVLQSLVANPDILSCTPESVIQAVLEAAQDGLEPTGARGGAWLIPFFDKGVRKAQLIRDYRGVIRLIVGSGAAKRVDAQEVRRGDHFEFHPALPVPIVHDVKVPRDGEVLGYYALFWLADGSQKAEYMGVDEVEKTRSKSKAKDSLMWTEFFGQGARKTVIKRGSNYLDLRPEIRAKLVNEDEAEFDYGHVTVEPVPPTDLAERRSAIHERTRRLTGGTEQPPAGETGEGRVSASPSTTPPAAGCPHPDRQHVVKPEGVVCGACGTLLAARDTEQPAGRAKAGDTAATPARGRGRSARSDRDEAEQPPSDDAAATAKAKAGVYAVASKRGLDHDGIHRLAAVTFLDPADREQFSCSTLVEAEWTALRDAIDRAPIGPSPEAVYPWVGQTAGKALGLPPDVLDDSKKLWTDNLDPLATALMGEPAGELTGAQWVLFALRVEAGERAEAVAS